MDTIILITALLLTLGWYLVDARKQSKTDDVRPVEEYWGVVYLNKEQKQLSPFVSEKHQADHIGRLYYSTPGQCYKGLIRDGRILKTGFPGRP